MKKLIVTLSLLFLVTGLWAQNDDGAKVVPVAQSINKNGYSIQVGLPLLGTKTNGASRTTTPADVRFPWGVLYLYNTFSEDSFDVSKGYFGDKILISWDIRANIELISSIKIYKREYTAAGDKPFAYIGSVAATVTQYEDKYAEGGVLFEYKLVATGVSKAEILYGNYITGIGYRSPTAIVTGNISYSGGTPVQDVIVMASAVGTTVNTGSALNIPASSSVSISNTNTPITTAVTYQAWVKPKNAYTTDGQNPIKLVHLLSVDNKTVDVSVNFKPTAKQLVVLVGTSEFKLSNYIPSGALNSRGDDIMVPVSNFNTSFTHFSVVINDKQVPQLYVNGRPITAAYKATIDAKLIGLDATYTSPYFEVTIPTQTVVLQQSNQEYTTINVGGGNDAYIDEIRIWKAALDTKTIRTDYTRYISGNDTRLVSYLRANEKVGLYAYDFSRSGFNFNKNHGTLGTASTPAENLITWTIGSGNYPSADQLGIQGVTDANGNYEITAIPYSGTGESFQITPLYGQHKFDPAQQLVFLGQGSEVVNRINFVDKSSFSFKGVVQYDTRGVFPAFAKDPKSPLNSATGLESEGYNSYQFTVGAPYPKGQYWLNDNGTPTNNADDFFEEYAKIFAQGANVYIDGTIVLDANNLPVVTNDEGFFDISVPIGNHYITVKKDGHVFNYNGRFPETGFKEFFEDSNAPVTFVDNTRVTVVGKVVGGAVEAAKTIGFGQNGFVSKSVKDSSGNTTTIEISAKNNIGKAELSIGYAPVGASVTPYTTYTFKTNSASGEYRIALMPLQYALKAEDINIPTATAISLLKTGTTESLDFSKITTAIAPEFSYKDGSVDKNEIGTPYNYEKSFIYRSTPELKVIEQKSDANIVLKGGDSTTTTVSTASFTTPIYTQFLPYKIVLNRYETYVNNDSSPAITRTVPVTDGELLITNNLALPDSESITTDGNKLTYIFNAGIPSITPPFLITSTLKYRINEVDYDVLNFKDTGIILGGKSDGSQTFVTAAPDIPAIILRDPPGSNSFATIEKGESISFTSESSMANTNGFANETTINGGFTFELEGGVVPQPKLEVKLVKDDTVGISKTQTSEDGKSVNTTYTFNKSISTSDATDYVGADGDLYIGNAKNIYYGSYDNVEVSATIPKKYENGVATDLDPKEYEKIIRPEGNLYISKQKALSFVDKPAETFFVYSQKHILTNLIPEYELFISTSLNSPDANTDANSIKRKEYAEKIRLWRKVILDNEKSKYDAKNNRAAYKNSLNAVITTFKKQITDTYNGTDDNSAKAKLTNQLKESNDTKALLDQNFEKNVSLDAGVGEYSQSVETTVVAASSTTYNLVLDESIARTLGATVNDMGFSTQFQGFFQQNTTSSLSKETSSTTNISYTLKDNDAANFLSVDVVNAFDGNGPIFITQGGRTSCPQEGAELSHFYNHTDYNATATTIEELADAKREQLSFATQKVEVPVLTVTDNDVANIPEGKKAEFELKFENNSAAGADANFLLVVDNTTNPNNAIFNIEPNGTIVNVPYGKTTIFKLTVGKSISDIYEYKDMKIRLQSLCDGEDVSSSVTVSAHFVPSCSSVTVSAPLNNWVYNNQAAYNTDGSTNPVSINLTGFTTKFKSFKKIDLEYRLASTPNWTRLQTYYGTQDFYDAAVANAEKEITFIGTKTSLAYSFDIAGLKLSDGTYEIRARSSCTNDTEYISDIITGKVDLHSPQRFGTPLPINGILGAGEDLKVSFNEPVFYNSAVSTIEIKGQTNQLEIDHNVSLYFDGAANTMVVDSPKITTGDLTFEFWMNNATTATNAVVLAQENGLNIKLANGSIFFTIGDIVANGSISSDNLFHHYTFTHKNDSGEVRIYQDDKEIGATTGNVSTQFTNNNALVLGGNTFKGNIHDLRLWNKSISLSDAYATMYKKLIGNEANLIGYWPLDEGRGTLAADKARSKHAVVNQSSWDIKPKGTSYEFKNGQYLTLTDVGSVQLTKDMDATVSFWMKTDAAQDATLFSNGKGESTDIIQTNGKANKWAINMNTSGNLSLQSEGNAYILTTKGLADNTWHHVTLLFSRLGALKTYVDAENVTSNIITNIGGFSGNMIWLGARGSVDLSGTVKVDRPFTGKIDEFQLWNTVRNVEQISRDRYNEVSVESIGLLLYARMNQPDIATGNGPIYYHAAVNNTVVASSGNILSGDAVNYSNDVPAIKPERKLIQFIVNHVINSDEMIVEPVVTDWASIEGQVLDITVHRMFDGANNMQQSPITWTAYVKRNEVSWFAEGYNEVVDIVKNVGDAKSFEITLLNKGGKGQPFEITNLPKWLTLSKKTGTISPDSKVILTATIDKEVTPGEYLENLYLKTDFGYDQKMQIKLRILAAEPNWTVNPADYKYSMSIVGRIKVDGKFSEDTYDKIAAFSNGEVRGIAKLVYNASYQQYYAFLTVYSNSVSNENINFKIWDASKGITQVATISGQTAIVFEENGVLGKLSLPVVFENSAVVEQKVAFNAGWTWVSMNVNDPNFANLNALTNGLKLETSDRMLTNSPARLETYFKNEAIPANSGWSGTISANGGLDNSKMVKVYMAHEQSLTIKGTAVDMLNWSFPIQEKWNWLPYAIGTNQQTNEALAYFDATDGDVIKSQNLFAIYDPLIGWNGTLNYLQSGQGYMIKSSKAQTFKYPSYLASTSKLTNESKFQKTTNLSQEAIKEEFKQYPENMNAVVLLPAGYNELYVYDTNGFLKGASVNQSVNDGKLSFITVYGDTAEELVFYIGNGISNKKTSKKFVFKGNDVLGTISKPIVLEEMIDGVSIYPNPFDNEITVKANAVKDQNISIRLYSLSGTVILDVNQTVVTGENILKIHPTVAIGVYVLQISINGEIITYKVMKN